MLALLRAALFPAQIERLTFRQFGIAFSRSSAVAAIARLDAFKVLLDQAVLANQSLQLQRSSWSCRSRQCFSEFQICGLCIRIRCL